jgi:7-carboxy-7-deazaguanine synthase
MQRNSQAPEKPFPSDGRYLAVNSVFHTIQGEGPFNGTPAVFVRLAGCNLRCPMCDTEYTERTTMAIGEIVDAVDRAVPEYATRQHPNGEVSAWTRAMCGLVVITGGEPFRQCIGPLIAKLTAHGYHVQVETNGTLFNANALNVLDEKLTIVCSPKTGKVNGALLPWISAFKYVATADSLRNSPDGLPWHALEHPNGGKLARPPHGHKAPIFLQPVDEQNADKNFANMDAVVDSCKRYGHRLCLQLHKIVGVP